MVSIFGLCSELLSLVEAVFAMDAASALAGEAWGRLPAAVAWRGHLAASQRPPQGFPENNNDLAL